MAIWEGLDFQRKTRPIEGSGATLVVNSAARIKIRKTPQFGDNCGNSKFIATFADESPNSFPKHFRSSARRYLNVRCIDMNMKEQAI